MNKTNEKFEEIFASCADCSEPSTKFQLNTLKLRCYDLMCHAKTLSEIRRAIPLIEKGIQVAKGYEAVEGVGHSYGASLATDIRVDLQDILASCWSTIGRKILPET